MALEPGRSTAQPQSLGQGWARECDEKGIHGPVMSSRAPEPSFPCSVLQSPAAEAPPPHGGDQLQITGPEASQATCWPCDAGSSLRCESQFPPESWAFVPNSQIEGVNEMPPVCVHCCNHGTQNTAWRWQEGPPETRVKRTQVKRSALGLMPRNILARFPPGPLSLPY